MKLSPRQRFVLEQLAKEDSETDLVYERGAGWWIGDEETHGKTAYFLIRSCLVKLDEHSRMGEYERYEINEDGKRALANPNFIPPIWRQI